MTILDEIIKEKKSILADIAEDAPVSDLEGRELFRRETVSVSQSLLDPERTGIIAEFKRRSPSLGIINPDADVAEIASGYFSEGASGVSVLTDSKFFGGCSDDMVAARGAGVVPLLRKDFIISEYQVIESKAIGADAILLIASVLPAGEILHLARLAHSIGLEVLLEIHNHEEVEKVNDYIDMVGVNNRDLKTFSVDITTSLKLADEIPAGFVKISESGISSPVTIEKLRRAGYNGFLMGETFMRSGNPVSAFSFFVNNLKRSDD